MHWINWAIVLGYLAYISIDGIRRAKGTKKLEGYFLGNRNLPWWVVGLSVMATQLSAITMIGTTGQGATDGMRFVQFYFGLPVALVILGVTLVPFLHRAKVYTAYEFLEKRFDAKTRSMTSFLFLLSRGLSCGTIIAAPAVVFSSIIRSRANTRTAEASSGMAVPPRPSRTTRWTRYSETPGILSSRFATSFIGSFLSCSRSNP